jgi:hypothetical protein
MGRLAMAIDSDLIGLAVLTSAWLALSGYLFQTWEF